MVDVVDRATRSRMMAGIKRGHTKPELFVRKLLSQANIRYLLHRDDLPGRPDIVVPSRNAAILTHGCFWHAHEGCRFATKPATRPEFWKAKLHGNVVRDEATAAKLNMLGWRVLVVWECATRRRGEEEPLRRQVLSWLSGEEPWGEISEKTLVAASHC